MRTDSENSPCAIFIAGRFGKLSLRPAFFLSIVWETVGKLKSVGKLETVGKLESVGKLETVGNCWKLLENCNYFPLDNCSDLWYPLHVQEDEKA